MFGKAGHDVLEKRDANRDTYAARKITPATFASLASVVVASLQELDPLGFHQIDATMFLSDSPRPHIWAKIFQWLWVADPLEWITQYGLDEFKEALGGAPFGLDPVAEIFNELWVEDR